MAVEPFFASQQDRMIPATAVAIGVHLLIIFGVGFGWSPPSSGTRSLAVTFALTPTAAAPSDAQAIAAENQLGNDDFLTEDFPAPSAASLVLAAPEPIEPAETPQPTADGIQEQITALQEEVAALTQQREQNNPRLGAVAARRAMDADYLLKWRRRVEEVGNALYRRATTRYGSGDVRLLVVVAADGSLEQVTVLTSSGTKELDQAAVETVRRAAPFPAFPADLKSQTPRLEIIRTWQFRSQTAGTRGTRRS